MNWEVNMTTPTDTQSLREAGSVTQKVTGRILQQLELGGSHTIF